MNATSRFEGLGYRSGGVPHFWRNEKTGELAAAVDEFLFGHQVSPVLTQYLSYVLGAPCWAGEEAAALSREVKTITTVRELDEWLERCQEGGIDPL